jgi:hypothetical protein
VESYHCLLWNSWSLDLVEHLNSLLSVTCGKLVGLRRIGLAVYYTRLFPFGIQYPNFVCAFKFASVLGFNLDLDSDKPLRNSYLAIVVEFGVHNRVT